MQEAQRTLTEILCVEQNNPDSLVIVLCVLNKGYRQFIKCPTREENIFYHCYTNVSNAYHAVPRAALGHSDHEHGPPNQAEIKTF